MRILAFTIIMSIITLSFNACSNNAGGGVGTPPPHQNLELSFVDEQGNDRLDPNHNSSLTEGNMEIFYLKEGEKERVYEGNLDQPKNFSVYHSEPLGKFIMDLSLSSHIETNGTPTTFVEFPDGTMDTVTMEPLNQDANGAKKYGMKGHWSGKLIPGTQCLLRLPSQ